MFVKLNPVFINGKPDARANTGKVGIITKILDKSEGKVERVYIGDEPVDVTGCECVVLAACLESGKLIEVAKPDPPSPKKTSARAPAKTPHFDKD